MTGSSEHFLIFACQEDIPFNTLAGYDGLTPTFHFPAIGKIISEAAEGFYNSCNALTPTPREGANEAVVSDIPTLAIGSLWDVQTVSTWAILAVSTSPNGQSTIIPEAGHGAVLYQPSAVDKGVRRRAVGCAFPETYG